MSVRVDRWRWLGPLTKIKHDSILSRRVDAVKGTITLEHQLYAVHIPDGDNKTNFPFLHLQRLKCDPLWWKK